MDGIGGSVGAPGFRSQGPWTVSWPTFWGRTKGTLFKGGALDVAGDAGSPRLNLPPACKGNGRGAGSLEMLVEEVAKFVAAELTLVPGARK